MSNKAKKKPSRKPTSKVPQKKANFLPLMAVAAVVICVAVVFLANRNKSNDSGSVANAADTVVPAGTQTENNRAYSAVDGVNTMVSDETQAINDATNRDVNRAVTITSGESLVIPTADITADVSFFPVEVDGTAMEVIAVKASDDTIRTAFNTCQSCYTSDRGYYEQEGNDLVCQNCGFHFTPDDVEITSGGCNPWPIFDENKTVTEDNISISYDFLVAAQGIFANRKGN